MMEQLHAQHEQFERKYHERISELERDRDRLMDDLVRLQMRSAS
jgi:ribosomal protein S10